MQISVHKTSWKQFAFMQYVAVGIYAVEWVEST